MLKSQYERERKLVDEKVRELAENSIHLEEDLERKTRPLKNKLLQMEANLIKEQNAH